jgi:hypothetical protein
MLVLHKHRHFRLLPAFIKKMFFTDNPHPACDNPHPSLRATLSHPMVEGKFLRDDFPA